MKIAYLGTVFFPSDCYEASTCYFQDITTKIGYKTCHCCGILRVRTWPSLVLGSKQGALFIFDKECFLQCDGGKVDHVSSTSFFLLGDNRPFIIACC